MRTIRRERPVISATMLGPEALHDLIEGALHRRERGKLLDHAVAARDGVPALHRLAVAEQGPRR